MAPPISEPDFSLFLTPKRPLVQRVLPIAAALTIGIGALGVASFNDAPQNCKAAAYQDRLPVAYPLHSFSPRQSLQHFDSIFLGEVVVATRPCSLGYCAGFRLLQPVKGKLPANVLVQVQKPDEGACQPTRFADKGTRWLIFGDRGMSKTGIDYVYSGANHPSFASNRRPNFNAMERRYRSLRAQLDKTIQNRLGKLPASSNTTATQ